MTVREHSRNDSPFPSCRTPIRHLCLSSSERARARSRIEPLRDDICGLRKFSFSRERSELSFFLNSPCSTLNGSQEHTPHRKRSPPLKRGLRSRASRSAREAELARRSRTGATKWCWPPKATGGSKEVIPDRGPG